MSTLFKSVLGAFVAVFATITAFAADATLPNGATEASFGDNTVTDGTTYYATLQEAVEAVCGTAGATLYCKPGADVGSLQHAPVTATLTIYGNGAYVSGGENRDFDIGNTDPSLGKDVTADMTLTVKDLAGCGAWGTKATEHTVNLVFENCANMGKVWLNGTTGTLNITIKDCAFEGVIKEAVYSNADGAITLNNVDFSNLTKAVNLNHKATGTQTVTIDGCDFVNCGANVAADEIPVRVLSSVKGGKSTLTVSGCTFSGTPEGGADVLLDYGVGVTEAAISGTAANVKPENKDGNAEMVAVVSGTPYEYSNVLPVAQIGTTIYKTLAAAVEAAQSGDTIVLIEDAELTASVEIPAGKEVTFDLNGKTLSASGMNVLRNNAGGKLTIKNGTVERTGDTAGYAVSNDNAASNMILENVTIKGGVYTSGALTATNANVSQHFASRHAIYASGCEVTLNSGTYHNYNAGNSAVFVANGATVTIEGGTFSIDNGKQTLGWTSNLIDVGNGSCVMNGGEFKGHFRVQGNGNLTINGGTFENTHGESYQLYTGAVVNVKGGTFTDATAKTFAANNLAAGYTLGENGAVVAPVAKIGEVYYTSLQAAINAAQEGDTITLISDINYVNVASQQDKTTSIYIPAGKKFTLDLNGYTISGENNVNGSFAFVTICRGADIIIDDTSANKSGKITYKSTREKSDYNQKGYTIGAMGTLVLNGGTIENSTPLGSDGFEKCVTTAIDIAASNGEMASFTMNGGVVISETYFAIRANVYEGNKVNSENVVVLNAGTVHGLHFCDWGSKDLNYKVAIGKDAVIECGNYVDYPDQSIRLIIAGAAASEVSIDIAEEAQIKGSVYSPVAKVGKMYSYNLAKAIAAAQEGGTIELLKDISVSDSVTIDKAITLVGNDKTLKFDLAASAFVIKSSNVVIKNMTIEQGVKDNSFHISIDKGAWDAPSIQYSDITIQNVNFIGGDYALCLIGEDVIVDSCTFDTQDSHNIIVYSLKGDSKIINNTFNASKGNNKSAILYEGGPSTSLTGDALAAFLGGGTLTVAGNTATDKGVFFQFTNWGLVKGMTLDISRNKIDAFTNKAIAIYTETPSAAAGDEFAAVTVKENIFTNVPSGRTIIKEYTGTVVIDASANYLGSAGPDYEALLVGDKVTVDSYYTEVSEDGTLGGLVSIEKHVAKIGDTNYETLADAFAAAKDGDTITLLGDCELVSGIDIDKNITVDGFGYKVYAADIADDTEMFNIRSKVTITNLTFDADHKFSYGIQVQDAADVTLSDVSILYAGNDNWGAAVNLNGGKLFVSGDFTAFSGGENGGAFPFTGILYWGGDFKFADGVTASIADPTGATTDSDLLLVGTVGLLSIEDADEFLSQFNIPSGFAPYTLALDADIVSSFGGFTGASPLPWNTIIDYGKQILSAIGESTTETQVTVGLLDDTVIPDVFVYEDANFSINGNGKTLTGTIDVTDNVGTISNVVLTSGTTFVLTNVTTGCVKFGDNVTISSPVTIVPPANYGVGSVPLIEFTDGSGIKPGDFVIDQSAVEIPEGTEFVVDGNKIVLGTPVAKIGEVKYASLLGAIAAAKSGDTVTLLGDCGITTGIILNKNITIDGGNFTLTAVSGDPSLAQMVKIESAATIKNITLAVNHKYDYGIQMNNPASNLTLENVTILYAGKAEGHKQGELLFGASVFLQQGNLLVKGKFTAFSGGETAGTFPFTGILYWPAGDTAPTFRFDTGATASIADPTGATSDSDLLLVGAPGILSVDEADLMLSAFNIPAGFAPYTLKLDCRIVQGVGGGFTGASPLAWNTIIDYGKKILTVVNESTTETQVEVGILDDVEIPEVFVYEDANFSINGNGKVLSGTIDFTDNVGTISNVTLTSGMTFVMTNVTEGCVKLGEGVIITEPVKVIPPDNFGRGKDSATLIEFAEGSGLSLEKFEIDTSTVQLPEGSQIVQDGNKIIVKLPIAQVGNRKFATLAEAFEAANDGDTVRVLYSFNANETIVINKAVTFDFSGDVITNTASGAAIQVTAVGVKFIGGELVAKGNGIVVAEGGSSVIERGVYEVTGDALAGAVTVSGGTFNKEASVINHFKSDDCEAVDNGDGWCTVMEYVAQFGEEKYVFLQDAINAAADTNPTVENPATVTLLGNVAGSVTLPDNVIISANGYTVQSVVDSNDHIVELHGGAYQAGKHPEQPPIRSIKIVGDKVQLSFVPRQTLKTVVVEVSSDLKAWTAMDGVTYVNDAPGKECVISVAKPQGNNAFFRVKFEYAD